MKQSISATNCILLLALSLLSCKKNTSTDLIVFDLNGEIPVKTLDIQDVAEIEYLKLELRDNYLFTELMGMTNNFIICYGEDRSVVFFDRTTGQTISKVSRYGNGPEEYNTNLGPVYSESKDELFVPDYPFAIKIYGRDGTFKRKLPLKKELLPNWGNPTLFDYDEEHLLLSAYSFTENMKDTSFVLISKLDGSVEGIRIPYEKKVDIVFMQGNSGVMIGATPENVCWAARSGRDYLLTEYSSDTVFRFTPERELIPVLVRTPSIQQMETKTLLHSWVETSQYLFFCTEKMEYDWKELTGFPAKGYLMEKRSGKFYQTNIQMCDYKGKELILGPSVIGKTPNEQIGIITLKASELQTANKENRLSGKLKEVTDFLTENDEYVYMILKFK